MIPVPPLQTLPNELIYNIVSRLGVKDVTDFSRTCQELYQYCQSREVSKYLVKSEFQFSPEVSNSSDANANAVQAVNRIVKRREALSEARPFSVAILGFASFYIYCGKFLWYIHGHDIRGLQLDSSARTGSGPSSNTELVINYHTLLQKTAFARDGYREGSLSLLHFQDGILSCLYRLSVQDDPRRPTSESDDSDYEEREPLQPGWLIVLDVKARTIVFQKPLYSTKNIFARHGLGVKLEPDVKDGSNLEKGFNPPQKVANTYLYYGFRKHDPYEKRHRWTLDGFDLTEKKPMGSFYHLQDINGFELGSTVCFEVIDGYFYAITNQSTYRAQEIDWSSFYHCIRFPLDDPCREKVEKTEERSMWRRQHNEGPLDDRWSNLSVSRDARTGKLIIIECRKELAKGERIAYKTDIVFPAPQLEGSKTQDGPTTTTPNIKTTFKPGGGTSQDEERRKQELLSLTHDRVALTLEDHQTPRFLAPQKRLASNVHAEPAYATFTFSATAASCYNASSSCFLDLVNDLPAHAPTVKQCVRLRACTRRPGLPPQDKSGVIQFPADDSMHDAYIDSAISFWPPPLPAFGQEDKALRQLHELLNPPFHPGRIKGTFDDTSLVYSVGKEGTQKALVFINFDPSLRLPGLKSWDRFLKEVGQPSVSHEHIGQLSKGKRTSDSMQPIPVNCMSSLSYRSATEYASSPQRKKRMRSDGSTTKPQQETIDLTMSDEEEDSLFRTASPLYLSIGQGFDFSVAKPCV